MSTGGQIGLRLKKTTQKAKESPRVVFGLILRFCFALGYESPNIAQMKTIPSLEGILSQESDGFPMFLTGL